MKRVIVCIAKDDAGRVTEKSFFELPKQEQAKVARKAIDSIMAALGYEPQIETRQPMSDA